MSPFQLNVVLLPGAKFTKGRDEDAGYDLYSMINAIFPPLTKMTFPVGIKTSFPADWVGLIADRSSRGCVQGLKYLGGVIDSNYRGEWAVTLVNLGREVVTIEAGGKAIAQVIFVPRGKCDINYVSTLDESARGDAWKGSTDECPKTEAV